MITREKSAKPISQSTPPIPGNWKVREEFHSLLRSLPWPANDPAQQQLSTIGFTSCLPREGVTTFAVQTALAAASSGAHQVLVVDANLRRPRLAKQLSVTNEQGLADILTGTCITADAIQETRYTNLSVLTAGKVDRDPATLFGLTYRIHDLIEVLSHGFDLVIFDLPSLAGSSAALPLMSPLDGLVMVVQSEKVPWPTAQEVREKLARADIDLLGAVVNKHRTHLPRLVSKLLFSS